MTALHAILAIEKGAKSAADKATSAVYNALQRVEPLSGISRTYRKKDDEGDDLPNEGTRVQTRVKADVLPSFQEAFARYLDVVATKDASNQVAKADVMIDGKALLRGVPVSTLLFLEKQSLEIKGIVDKIPTLDPSSEWTYDENSGVWKSPVVTTVRSKKVPKNWVKAEATDKHPAQVEIFHEDVLVGYWDKVDFSGAMSAEEKRNLQARIAKFQDAVRVAREAANAVDVTDVKVGQAVLDYVFG